jgi:hypothetical protein
VSGIYLLMLCGTRRLWRIESLALEIWAKTVTPPGASIDGNAPSSVEGSPRQGRAAE